MANVINIGGGAGGGSGSSVVPNPQGTATDTLTKLGIEGTIYDFASGGGGGSYIDTDTVIQAQTAIPANTDVTYTATQDCVVVYYINIVANSMGVVSVDGVNVAGGWATSLTGSYGCVFLATGQTITLRQTYTTEDGVYTVYGILGGSSGDYIHELLWDYVNDNSGTIPFGTYSVTLAESIDKYDCISMCFKSASSDAGNWGQVTLFLIDVNALKTNPMHANYFSYTSFGERSSAFYLSGKTLQKIIDNINNTNGLVAVYGIKYGGNNIKYSTDEQIVGTWVDGSTLYEKTVLVQNVTLANDTTTDIAISDYISNFGFPISLETLCYNQNQYLTLPYYVGGQYVIEAFFNGGSTISVYRNGGAITVDLYFTIRYTKSTT